MLNPQLSQSFSQPAQRLLDHRPGLTFALNAKHTLVARVAEGDQALFERPVGRVEGIGVKSYFHVRSGLGPVNGVLTPRPKGESEKAESMQAGFGERPVSGALIFFGFHPQCA